MNAAEQSASAAGMVQVALSSADPAALADFYRRALGLETMFETAGMIFLGAGAVRLLIGPQAQGHGHGAGGIVLYFEPPEWDAGVARCVAAGAEFHTEAQVLQRDGARELALRAFKDPEGYQLALLGWRASA